MSTYNILRVGDPLGLFKTYVYDGLFQEGDPVLPGQPVTNPRPATQRVKDIAGGPTANQME